MPPEFETLHGPLRLRIDFFFDGMTNLDTDNIIKPIQDALEDVLCRPPKVQVKHASLSVRGTGGDPDLVHLNADRRGLFVDSTGFRIPAFDPLVNRRTLGEKADSFRQ